MQSIFHMPWHQTTQLSTQYIHDQIQKTRKFHRVHPYFKIVQFRRLEAFIDHQWDLLYNWLTPLELHLTKLSHQEICRQQVFSLVVFFDFDRKSWQTIGFFFILCAAVFLFIFMCEAISFYPF